MGMAVLLRLMSSGSGENRDDSGSSGLARPGQEGMDVGRELAVVLEEEAVR